MTRSSRPQNNAILKGFDWSFNPAIHRKDIYALVTGCFIRQSKDLLFLGPPGVGKMHVAEAVGYEATKMSIHVLYRSISDLVRDFVEDEASGPQDRKPRRYLNLELLIIDDFGLKQLSENSGAHLVDEIMRRNDNPSTIVTGSRPLEERGKLLGDVPTTDALLDRFLHHAQTMAIAGRSYRLKYHAAIAGKEDKNKMTKSKPNEPSTAEPAS